VAIWSRLQAFVFGGAIARAGSDSVAPVLEPVRQHAWKKNQLRVLEANLAARLVASGGVTFAEAAEEASRSGYAAERLSALVYLAQVAPGVAEALTLYRRKLIGKAELEHAYAKAQIEPDYWDALTATAELLLTPAEVANAIQQGHLPNPGVLPDVSPAVTPAQGVADPLTPDGQPPSDVPLTTVDLDPLAEAAGAGVDLARLKVLANLAGLPPGAETLLAMWNRGLITETAVDAGIREGHLKTKWTGAFKRMRWAVLSAPEAASARLRQWITAEESYRIGALTGHSEEQMDLLFLNRGRPASPTQMWRAWARGATGPRGVPTEYEDHAKAIAISDIRPEYAEMLWETRFNYPAMFMLNRLAIAKVIDVDTAADWAHKSLVAPEVIDALRAYWGGAAGAASKEATKAELDDEYQGGYITADEYAAALGGLGYSGAELDLELHLGDARRLKRWREKVVDAIGGAYTTWAIDAPTATSQLAEVHITGDTANRLLDLWNIDRTVTVSGLTAAQVKKAYGAGELAKDVALVRLEDLHMPAADAELFLGA
jgi:hypothetical protein